jgi:hypothetical protein
MQKQQTQKETISIIENYKKETPLKCRNSCLCELNSDKKYVPVIVLPFEKKMELKKKKILLRVNDPFIKVSQYIHSKLKEKNIIMDESQALTCFVNGKFMLPSDMLFGQIEKEYADAEDKNIYIVYCPQVAFGNFC